MTARLAPVAERRRTTRCLPAPGTACRVTDGWGQRLWPACVRDLSASNVGLLVREAVEVGTLLALEVFNGEYACTVLAVCTRREPAGAGWVLGCEFATPVPAAAVAAFRQGAGRSPA
jgi:hypothetical protein